MLLISYTQVYYSAERILATSGVSIAPPACPYVLVPTVAITPAVLPVVSGTSTTQVQAPISTVSISDSPDSKFLF